MHSDSTPEACDLLIEPGYVVPVVPHAVVLEDHAVAIRGDKIVDILPTSEARRKYAAARTVSRPHAALIPGFVNAHTHNPMSLMRGVADDLPLKVWLQQHIWPIEAAVIGPEFVEAGCTHAVAEMLRCGTTTCNENYFFPDIQAQTYEKLGFRVRVGLPVIDFPTAWAKDDDEYFARAEAVHLALASSKLVSTAMAPHAPYTVDDDNFSRVRDMAEKLGIPVHLHLHETAQEVEQSIADYGVRPIERLRRLGLINRNLIAVHMTQLTREEIHLCSEQGVSVVHCPESNLKLASGFCPACALMKAGVNLAIGTDGVASNNDLDMIGETRTAAILAKAVAEDASALSAPEALRAATLGGAKAMHLDHDIGSIEVGKQADLACIDLSSVETQPLFHVISQIIYAASRNDVSDVWIAGKQKLEKRVLVDMDESAVLANAHVWREKIAAVGVQR